MLTWADERRRLQIWANGDYPRDAERAREFGAQGIGLCRTEHMFMEQERLPDRAADDPGRAAGRARSGRGRTATGGDREAPEPRSPSCGAA